MTERYVSHCICQACKAKQINIKPSDFYITESNEIEGGKWATAVWVRVPYLNFYWYLYGSLKVNEYYINERGGFAMFAYNYPSIAEWARRVVARFETRLRLYSKRLGR